MYSRLFAALRHELGSWGGGGGSGQIFRGTGFTGYSNLGDDNGGGSGGWGDGWSGQYMLASLGTLCSPPPGGPNPPAPPGSSSEYSQSLNVYGEPVHVLLENVPVTCAETGVTLDAICASGATFYLTTDTVYNYTSSAGTYPGCAGGGAGNAWGSGSSSGTPGNAPDILVDLA